MTMSQQAFSEVQVGIEDLVNDMCKERDYELVTSDSGRASASWVLMKHGSGVEIVVNEVQDAESPLDDEEIEDDFTDKGEIG